MSGGSVPFHRRAKARVEIGLAGGDHAEFEGAAAALALAHRVIGEKLAEPPAVFVRAAVDHDEPIRRAARLDRLRPAAVAPADRRARPASGIGDTDRGTVHDAEHRSALLDERDQHRKFAVPGDELAGAVARVDRPETVAAGRHALGLA